MLIKQDYAGKKASEYKCDKCRYTYNSWIQKC